MPRIRRRIWPRLSVHQYHKYWLPLLDARLEALWMSGKSIVTIAAILKAEGHAVSRNAIAGRRKRLGLPSRGSPLGRSRLIAARVNRQSLEHIA